MACLVEKTGLIFTATGNSL